MDGIRRRLFVCSSLVVLSLFPSLAFSDGKGFPLPAVPMPPSIPQQRAMIVWKDGVETLAVESTFKTESKEVGWVLPLPAKPTSLETASPGMLQSMSFSLRPRITSRVWNGIEVLLPLLIVCSVVTLIAIFSSRVTFLNYLLMIALTLFVISIVLPSASRSKMGLGEAVQDVADVTVLSSQDVGHYATTVLQVRTPEALSDWLRENGFTTLEEKDTSVVQDYITRQWVFVVAKLRKENSQLLTPHPILATFPAGKPIYPMKLTALAGEGKTRLELFVVADQQAQAEGYKTIASDTFMPGGQKNTVTYDMISQPCYQSRDTDLIIGNPDAQNLLWPGCVVTKLSADLSPANMTRDVEFTMKSCSPYREHFYTKQAKSNLIENICSFGMVIVVILLGMIFRRSRDTHPCSRELIFPLGVLIWIILVAVILWIAIPAGDALQGIEYANFRWSRYQYHSIMSIQMAVEEGKIKDSMSDEEMKDAIYKATKEWLGGWPGNPYTREAVVWERSPGNFWIHRQDGSVYFCVYDFDGREHRLNLGREEKTMRSEGTTGKRE